MGVFAHGVSERRRGFTLMEIMFALAIAAVVGAAVSSMLFAVSDSTVRLTDFRRASMKQKVVSTRINDAVRSSRMLLGHDRNSLLLWRDDVRANGQPNLSEITRLEWDRTTGELWQYAARPGLDEADDPSYRLGDDFEAITDAYLGSETYPGRLWATGVIGWSPQIDDAEQDTRLVRYNLTVDKDGVVSEAGHTAALRSR